MLLLVMQCFYIDTSMYYLIVASFARNFRPQNNRTRPTAIAVVPFISLIEVPLMGGKFMRPSKSEVQGLQLGVQI